jgi:glycosyltransferase involved in cell wall biosynthesis
MKICLIGPTYPFRGGISHYTTLLYKYLLKRHEVQFFAFKRQYPRWLFPGKTDIDPSQTQIQEEGAQRILDSIDPVSWGRVALKIIKSNPDLLIIPWWVSFWTPQFWTISVLVKRLSKVKILFLCHNVVEHESNWINKSLTYGVLRNGDLFIVHSAEDKKNLLAMFPNTKVRRSFHPTYDVFNQGEFDGAKVKERFGIKGNVILFFGFVREYKGLKYLLKALPEVLSKVNVTLLVVGEFWKDKDEYISLINQLGIEEHIVLVDEYVPNEEIGDYFSAADLVVQPYTSATGSGVIQTAFGFNKPVVATKVGSLPEVIEDGKTGYLVQPKASHEIAKTIIRFFCEANRQAFYGNIEKEKYKFSWDRMVDVIEELACIRNLT